jgi:hypothetical protein
LAASCLKVAVLIALACALGGCHERQQERALPADNSDTIVGVSTSLPLLWQEAADFGDLLDSDAPAHWAKPVLEAAGTVRPLDTLADGEGHLPLTTSAVLLLAQPYPLSPQENVALDEWVRGGGHVLLFADPMLTAHSIYPLGDRRRPQDVVLLSPILQRWGLGLEFIEDQPAGQRDAAVFEIAVPVDLPGRFIVASGNGACTVRDAGLAAVCSVGKGKVYAIADAALLDAGPGDDVDARGAALSALLRKADARD